VICWLLSQSRGASILQDRLCLRMLVRANN